tara:strand:+ start:570 stop:758 length:189 start_codon:yes stop_codon:yes gene_type:complete
MREEQLKIIMNKKGSIRCGFLHLYNPKEEGLGTYDINYINAFKKNKELKDLKKKNERMREVA